MGTSEFLQKLKFKTLARSMVRLGLDPDSVDDKEEAVAAIHERFAVDGLEIEFECESCGGDLPDIDFCPFCGAVLSDEEEPEPDLTNKAKGIPGELYRGARRGRLPKDEIRIAGTKLLARMVGVLGISQDYIRYKKSVTSLWCHWGMFARCFLGTFSVRIHLPFEAGDYEDPNGIVIDLEAPIKNMKSRLALESLDEVEEVVGILKQTVILKREQSDSKKKKKQVSKIKSKVESKPKRQKEKPKPPSKPSKPRKPRNA